MWGGRSGSDADGPSRSWKYFKAGDVEDGRKLATRSLGMLPGVKYPARFRPGRAPRVSAAAGRPDGLNYWCVEIRSVYQPETSLSLTDLVEGLGQSLFGIGSSLFFRMSLYNYLSYVAAFNL